MRHAFELLGAEHEVWLSSVNGRRTLHLGDQRVQASLTLDADGRGFLICDGASTPVSVATRGDDVFIHLDGHSYRLLHREPIARAAGLAQGASDEQARAPMPGTVVSLLVQPGQPVVRGQPLLVMESMKLETTIAAWRNGVVDEIRVAVGQSFDRDALLLTLAA